MILHISLVLAAFGSLAVAGGWRLPPHNEPAEGFPCFGGLSQTCVVVAEGDSAALISALIDDRITEIWLSGAVTLPALESDISLKRDIFLGGLEPFTGLTFDAGAQGAKSGLLHVHGFLVLYRLRLYGFFEFVGPQLESNALDEYKIFGVVNVLPIRMEERLPEMDPFQQEWPDEACTSGVAMYEVDGQLSFGSVVAMMLSAQDGVAQNLLDVLFTYVLEMLDLGLVQWSPELGELISHSNVLQPTNYTFMTGEWISHQGWPCAYMSAMSQSITGFEEQRLPLPDNLHPSTLELRNECQTDSHLGKDYIGDINTTVTGRLCVPWEDVAFFDAGFDFIEGNSCRNPTQEPGVWCFIENPEYGTDRDVSSIRSVPRHIREFCNVPLCHKFQPASSCQHVEDTGESYVGSENHTESGEPCLAWADISWQYGHLGPPGFNSCRKPARWSLSSDDLDSVWCWTNSSSRVTKEKCSVPICEHLAVPVTYLPHSSHQDPNSPAEDADHQSEGGSDIIVEEPANPVRLPTELIAGLVALAAIVLAGLAIWRLFQTLRMRSVTPTVLDVSDPQRHTESPCLETDSKKVSIVETSHSSHSKMEAASGANIETLEYGRPTDLGLVSIIRGIGSGATSRVYQAQWLGSQVAVKIIRLDDLPSTFRSALVESAEANLSHMLTHPNVVQNFHVYRVLSNNKDKMKIDDSSTSPMIENDLLSGIGRSAISELWIVQEWCDMGDLTSNLIEPGCQSSQSFKKMLDILLQVAAALCYLHLQKIVHGDLKRANVLLKNMSDSHVCKVTDFGLAHVMESDQDYYFSDWVAGDIAYMAPEAALQNRISPKMDIFSFGMMMYELYSGTRAVSPGATYATHVQRLSAGQRPEMPSETPAAFEELCKHCWAENPEDRPSSEDIIQALKAMGGILDIDVSPEKLAATHDGTENLSIDYQVDGYDIPGLAAEPLGVLSQMTTADGQHAGYSAEAHQLTIDVVQAAQK